MRILLVTHYFPPEIGAPQARLSEFARAWASSGDDVTVLTGLPNHPTGVVPPEYRGTRLAVEHTAGHRVVRTWLYATPNEGVVRKTLGHLSFMVTSVALGGRAAGPADVVVVSSPTFFSIISAWLLARLRQARLVVEIRDLWPAIFVELGVLTNPTAIRLLEAVELASYRAADAVVVVTEGFADDLIRRGVPASKVHVIRNGVDLERFAPGRATPAQVATTRATLGAGDDETLVLYVGAHGISHGLTSVADAAALLADVGVHVAFVGEGAAKAALADHVRERAIANVSLHAGVPRDEVPALLAAADICLVPLRDVPLFSSFIPSKIFEYFGAGRAVVGSVRGEPATILRDGGAVVVEPEQPGPLAAAIRELADDPARRAAMGAEGRRYVEREFDRRAQAERYRALLHRLVDEPPAAVGAVGPRPAPRDASPEAVGALVRFVWSHPHNRAAGPVAQVAALGRLAGWQVWQRTTHRPWTTRLPNGLRLRVHPHSTAASGVIYTRLPEWEDMCFVADVVGPGDTFVDVGANVGVFSLLAAGTPGVTVHAYEPSAASFGRLEENVAINGLGRRVHAHRRAVGDEHGTVRLTVGLDTINQIVLAETADVPTEVVPLVPLDDDLPPDGRIACMKIDVEGHEEQVLRGARRRITTDRPAIVVEANDRDALAGLLGELGYRPYRYDPAQRRLHGTSWDDRRGNNLLAVADLEAAEAALGRSRR